MRKLYVNPITFAFEYKIIYIYKNTKLFFKL